MKCFCSQSRPDCPPTRQKECDPEVSHCLLSLLWNEDSKSFVESIQDCWMWSDKSRCPVDEGPCHVLQESVGKFMACCCKGSLCNNATDLQFVSNTGSEAIGLPQFPAKDNLTVTTTGTSESSPGQSKTFSLTFIAVPSVLLFCLALLLFSIVYYCHRRGWPFKLNSHFKVSRPKHRCECQLIKLKSSGFLPPCTCERFNQDANIDTEKRDALSGSRKPPSVGCGWLAPDELEGLASAVKLLELKSQGCFGQVWRASLQSTFTPLFCQESDSDVAVKIFRAAQQDSWSIELALFRVPGLRHPNILKFFGADQVLNDCLDPPEMEYWLITEYHQLGSLYDYLKSHTVSWNELLKIAVGIARGLSHLHSEVTTTGGNSLLSGQMKPSIAHRDLNSRNVLLKSDLSACIADFGLAIRFEPGQFPSEAHPQLGTRRYMAPEVLDGAIQFSRDAYLRIDVYAMGLVFWELMSRCFGTKEDSIDFACPYKAPFEAELGPAPTIEELQRFVAQEKQRPRFNPNWSQCPSMCSLWETTEECWDQDAEARLSAGCVAERLTLLSTQPWSGSKSSGPGLVESRKAVSPVTSIQMTGSTTLPTTTGFPVRSAHRTGPNTLVSFPVPSVSVPVSIGSNDFYNPTIYRHFQD